MVKASPGYEANRVRISLALSEFTVPLLSRIYRAFDGDMVASIVLSEGDEDGRGFWRPDSGRRERTHGHLPGVQAAPGGWNLAHGRRVSNPPAAHALRCMIETFLTDDV
jgi:hypothetical protein